MAASKRYPTGKPGVFFRLAKRVGGNGEERIYYVVYKNNGKLVEVKAGRQYVDGMTPSRAALLRSDLIEKRMKPRQEVRKEAATLPTIKNLYTAYAGHRSFSSKAVAFNKYLMSYLDAFLDLTPDQISTAALDKLRCQLLSAGKSPQTVKHILGMLKRVLNYAIKHELCPMPLNLHFNMPKVNNTKIENLTSEQIKKLLDVLDKETDQIQANLMRLALFTGVRRSALLALTWSDIDFECAFILLRAEHAKSQKTETIPMNEQARGVLEALRKIVDGEYVFPGRDAGKHRTEIKRFTTRVKKEAGLPKDFRPMHGLRHTFASLLASSGQVGLYELQKLLTHSSPQMTQRYAHLTDAAMRRATNVADAIFGEMNASNSK